MQHKSSTLKSPWIFLSKGGKDQYINMFAQGSGGSITNTDNFCYEHSNQPIVLRGILKHKIMKRCLEQSRSFYYMDTGYFGNMPSGQNPNGWKLWHRIVHNDLQHSNIIPRPGDRLQKFGISIPQRRYGSQIIVAAPDDKPCRYYGIDRDQWLADVLAHLSKVTDRPVVVRERVRSRQHRVMQDPLNEVLKKDVHALVTFNSNSAVESILSGVPAFVLAPTHAAQPVSNMDLDQINNPIWPQDDLIYTWLCHLSYGQFHVNELRDGTAYKLLQS